MAGQLTFESGSAASVQKIKNKFQQGGWKGEFQNWWLWTGLDQGKQMITVKKSYNQGQGEYVFWFRLHVWVPLEFMFEWRAQVSFAFRFKVQLGFYFEFRGKIRVTFSVPFESKVQLRSSIWVQVRVEVWLTSTSCWRFGFSFRFGVVTRIQKEFIPGACRMFQCGGACKEWFAGFF